VQQNIDSHVFGETIKNFLFDQYLRAHRNAEDLIKSGKSKTLEFKSTLRWNLKEDRKHDRIVTHAVLKTIAAFLNTEGGDLLIGVADDGPLATSPLPSSSVRPRRSSGPSSTRATS
jgi:hypothetical protein